MAKYPALPLFTDAYLGDTRHLTTLQHGAYIIMLIVAWRTPGCCLPNDDVYLARITGLDRRTWQANKAVLLAFWKVADDNQLTQGRLKDERNFVEQVRNKNSAAGKASALKRLNREPTTVQPDANANSTPTPTPTPTPKDEKTTGSRLSVDALPDEWKQWCVTKRPDLDPNEVFAEFKDYWIGVPGARGRKTDWFATWRNRVRDKKQGKVQEHGNHTGFNKQDYYAGTDGFDVT